MTYELRVLEGVGEIEQALRLRVRVWRDANVDLPVDACGRHRDGDDAASTHVGVLIGERLLAASRMTPLTKIREHSFARPLSLDPSLYPGTVCFLSRLVVAPEARGRGLGRSLIEWMVNRAHAHGAAWVAATSSVRAIQDVLRSLRFVPVEDIELLWGTDWRSVRLFVADTAAAAVEIRKRAGREGGVTPTAARSDLRSPVNGS